MKTIKNLLFHPSPSQRYLWMVPQTHRAIQRPAHTQTMILLNLLDCFVSLGAQSIDRSSKFLDFLRDFFSKAAHWGTNCARENGNFPQKKRKKKRFFQGFLLLGYIFLHTRIRIGYFMRRVYSKCPGESFTVLKYITTFRNLFQKVKCIKL